jgi:hypothetical protein
MGDGAGMFSIGGSGKGYYSVGAWGLRSAPSGWIDHSINHKLQSCAYKIVKKSVSQSEELHACSYLKTTATMAPHYLCSRREIKNDDGY